MLTQREEVAEFRGEMCLKWMQLGRTVLLSSPLEQGSSLDFEVTLPQWCVEQYAQGMRRSHRDFLRMYRNL